jgi:putative transposase
MHTSHYDPEKHHRRSIRLKGYDYSQPGAYFVTICTRGKQCLLGKIVNGEMKLNELGEIVEAAWFDLPAHYSHVELGTFCIMPNHVHMIIILNDGDTRVGGDWLSSIAEMQPPSTLDVIQSDLKPTPPKRHPLSEIVRALKTFSARRINEILHASGTPVWQRDYYERVIRNEQEYDQIALYINSNPLNWLNDEDYFEG